MDDGDARTSSYGSEDSFVCWMKLSNSLCSSLEIMGYHGHSFGWKPSPRMLFIFYVGSFSVLTENMLCWLLICVFWRISKVCCYSILSSLCLYLFTSSDFSSNKLAFVIIQAVHGVKSQVMPNERCLTRAFAVENFAHQELLK